MDCKTFRDRHSLYVDLRCSALDENEMRDHVRECEPCARHDMLVRRSLLLVHSLPDIQPSPDFRARLEARLRAVTPFSAPAPHRRRPRFKPFVALAASVAFITWLARDLVLNAPADEITLPPVVASAPEPEPSPVATPAFVATVPTGMSVWPAIMVASQAPFHFVAAEMASER